MTDSIIIIAPSTTIPKSIAPKESKFAETPNKFISIRANNNESGIMDATISPALISPIKIITTNITIIPPSSKFFLTVEIVFSIRFALSK